MESGGCCLELLSKQMIRKAKGVHFQCAMPLGDKRKRAPLGRHSTWFILDGPPRGQQPARAGFYGTLRTVFAELGYKVNLRTSCRYLLDLVALSRGVVSVESSSTVSQPVQRFFLRIARIPGKSTPPFPSS